MHLVGSEEAIPVTLCPRRAVLSSFRCAAPENYLWTAAAWVSSSQGIFIIAKFNQEKKNLGVIFVAYTMLASTFYPLALVAEKQQLLQPSWSRVEVHVSHFPRHFSWELAQSRQPCRKKTEVHWDPEWGDRHIPSHQGIKLPFAARAATWAG